MAACPDQPTLHTVHVFLKRCKLSKGSGYAKAAGVGVAVVATVAGLSAIKGVTPIGAVEITYLAGVAGMSAKAGIDAVRHVKQGFGKN